MGHPYEGPSKSESESSGGVGMDACEGVERCVFLNGLIEANGSSGSEGKWFTTSLGLVAIIFTPATGEDIQCTCFP
jgi:hypothetical protein